MKFRPSRLLSALMLGSVSMGSLASGAVIEVVGATSTTTIGAPRTITAAISGLGLSSGGTSGNVLTETHDGGGSNTHYLSDQYPTGGGVNQADEVLTFDLGGAYNVNGLHYWAYNRPERARGIQTFDISFSTDGGNNYSTAVSAASINMADWTIGSSSSSATSTSDFRSFDLQNGVTHIRFTNISNFGQSRIALAEIRFEGTVVPEPSALLLCGAGGLLLLRRRRA